MSGSTSAGATAAAIMASTQRHYDLYKDPDDHYEDPDPYRTPNQESDWSANKVLLCIQLITFGILVMNSGILTGYLKSVTLTERCATVKYDGKTGVIQYPGSDLSFKVAKKVPAGMYRICEEIPIWKK